MSRLTSAPEPGRRRSPDALVSELVDCRVDAVRLARVLVGGQDAEDVAHEAIVRVLRTARRGVVIDNPRAYLRTTVRHVAADHQRTARRESLPGELPERASGRADPHAAAELHELVAALDGLPKRQRAALLATVLSGEDQTQLTGLLGTTPAGVRQLVRRARQGLRERLGAWVPAPVAWLAARAKRVISVAGASGAAHGAAAAVIVTVVIVAPKPPVAPPAPKPAAPSLAGAVSSRLQLRAPTPPRQQVRVRTQHP